MTQRSKQTEAARRLMLSSLALCFVATLAAACSTNLGPRQADRLSPDTEFSVAPPTERVAVGAGDIERRIILDGRVMPRDSRPVVSPVVGTTTSLQVARGDRVEAGDVVATVELSAEATIAMLRYQLAIALGEPTSPDIEVDSGLEQSFRDASEGRASIDITADRSGTVVSTETLVGQAIDVGAPIIVVGDPGDLVAQATTSSTATGLIEGGLIAVGTTADLIARNSGGNPATGSVVEIIADNGTVLVQLDDATAFELGARVEISIAFDAVSDATWVPPTVVRGSGDDRFVLVDRDGSHERVDVEIGLESDTRVEIVGPTSLLPGDLVVSP